MNRGVCCPSSHWPTNDTAELAVLQVASNRIFKEVADRPSIGNLPPFCSAQPRLGSRSSGQARCISCQAAPALTAVLAKSDRMEAWDQAASPVPQPSRVLTEHGFCCVYRGRSLGVPVILAPRLAWEGLHNLSRARTDLFITGSLEHLQRVFRHFSCVRYSNGDKRNSLARPGGPSRGRQRGGGFARDWFESDGFTEQSRGCEAGSTWQGFTR